MPKPTTYNGTLSAQGSDEKIGTFSFVGEESNRAGALTGTFSAPNKPEQVILDKTEKEADRPLSAVTGTLTVKDMKGAVLATVTYAENGIETTIGTKAEKHTGQLKAQGLELFATLSTLAGAVANNQNSDRLMRNALLSGLGVSFKEEPAPTRAEPKAITPTPRAGQSVGNYHAAKKPAPAISPEVLTSGPDVKKGSSAARLNSPFRG